MRKGPSILVRIGTSLQRCCRRLAIRNAASRFGLSALCTVIFLALACFAQDLRPPASAIAGEETTLTTTGTGSATFYLTGPGTAWKTDVELGKEIRLSPKDLTDSGNYLAVLCTDTCRNVNFYVAPAKAASVTFLVHPSRVPVGLSDAVSGVALPYDQFHNLVTTTGEIHFQLSSGNASLLSQNVRTHDGIAWFRTSSGKNAGVLQISATLGDVTSRRAVQQVASEPCNLRIKGQRTTKGIEVETEPVKDCSGNPVPDGTIVSFTASNGNEKSTVDAPIKRGIARAQMEAPGAATISAASGVVMGNELRIGAQR